MQYPLILMSVTVLFTALMTAILIYQLLPVLICQCRRCYRNVLLSAVIPTSKKHQTRKTAVWLEQMLQKQQKLLRQAGYEQEKALRLLCGFQICCLLLGLIVCLFSNQSFVPMFASVLLISQVNGFIHHRAKIRQKHFAKNVYKIYRFIHEQVDSGILMSDALKGLPSIVRDPIVHPVLTRLAALYELTLDSERAFTILSDSFGDQDTRFLAAQIRQCLDSGITGTAMARMETLLFTRNFTLLQEETNRIRSGLFWIVTLALIMVLVVFLYPMLLETSAATRLVFS